MLVTTGFLPNLFKEQTLTDIRAHTSWHFFLELFVRGCLNEIEFYWKKTRWFWQLTFSMLTDLQLTCWKCL